MERKHTPGPWTLDRTDWMDRPSQDIYVSGGEYEDEDGSPCAVGVAIVVCTPTGEVGGNANARLISAAPDLLAACEAVVSAWESKSPLAWQPENNHALLDNLRSAILKAIGGAQ